MRRDNRRATEGESRETRRIRASAKYLRVTLRRISLASGEIAIRFALGGPVVERRKTVEKTSVVFLLF